ncbi:MAG: cyclic pyranopterin monophosphate synthase accessory protein [Phycisphaerae bacterium]|jgi:cyclic pyranopterin phosphate synthase|nr:MAG: cyclic pyranopterin monophosphate synthase accessory protein [Phycisphaerae bacterium]
MRRSAHKITPDLTHVDSDGRVRMVDVGEKPVTRRTATAEATVVVSRQLAKAIRERTVKKGDLLTVAEVAGTMAAKRTADLIPLCHPLPIQQIDVKVRLIGRRVRIRGTVITTAQTGVEMEALTAVSIASLTVVDMGKSIDRGITIQNIRLLEKTGGTRGDYRAVSDSPIRQP